MYTKSQNFKFPEVLQSARKKQKKVKKKSIFLFDFDKNHLDFWHNSKAK